MKPQTPGSSHHGPLGLDVQLLYRPIGLVGAVAHWISEEGMQVDTGRVVLEHLSEVEIAFAHRQEERTVFHRIPAHVNRCADGKTLLRFAHGSGEALQALLEMMASHLATPAFNAADCH